MSFSPNAFPATKMSTEERLIELASILGAVVLRARAAKSSKQAAVPENSSLDFAGDQSGVDHHQLMEKDR